MDFLWTCYGSLEGFSYGLLMQLRISKKNLARFWVVQHNNWTNSPPYNQTCIGKSVDFQPSNLVHGILPLFNLSRIPNYSTIVEFETLDPPNPSPTPTGWGSNGPWRVSKHLAAWPCCAFFGLEKMAKPRSFSLERLG